MNKVVILRPGALGDVLAVRSVIRFVRDTFPKAEICLVAPGERGAFFQRPGWADRCYDWERGAFSWLFSSGSAAPPPVLQAIFAKCDWLLSYVDAAMGGGEDNGFAARLDTLARSAAKIFCLSRPHDDHGEAIGIWLARAAVGFCQTYSLIERDAPIDWEGLAAARVRMPELLESACGSASRYVVVHPGSGSAKKNWPLEHFRAVLDRMLQSVAEPSALVVVSGEADGELGERLAASFPGASHLHNASLETVAQVLAHAWFYMGNDSGISHLAAAVESADGRVPAKAVVFGPSDPSIWAPPGALVLRAGEAMDALSPAEAWQTIGHFLNSGIR